MNIKVAILSAGLGNVSRGFEISASLWYESLKNSNSLEVRLFSGGNHPSATKIPNFGRDGFMARQLRRLKLIKDGCRLEQLSFGVGFLLNLIRYQPDIIWLQEGNLADLLLFARKVFSLKFKIIFCDGAPLGHQFADKFDYIIFLHQFALDQAIKEGVKPEKCRVIPHLKMKPSDIDKKEARDFFNLPPDKFIVICVAAWNKHHKRIDYLLNEFAALNQDNYLLVLCGQEEKETDELKNVALSHNLNTRWFTLSQQELSFAYRAADLFVLPSINEGLGMVLIEAGSHKLPIICHPHLGAKYILGKDYKGLKDLSIQGNLKAAILEMKDTAMLKELTVEAHYRVTQQFDNELLVKRLEDFIVEIAATNSRLNTAKVYINENYMNKDSLVSRKHNRN